MSMGKACGPRTKPTLCCVIDTEPSWKRPARSCLVIECSASTSSFTWSTERGGSGSDTAGHSPSVLPSRMLCAVS